MSLPMIVITEGTLVFDPELRYTQDGVAVTSFRVASNSRRKSEQTGEWENADSTFLTVSCFRGLAENVAREFSKGNKVNIIGRLKQRDVERNGQKRTFYDVNADNVSKPISRFNDTEGNNTPQGGGNSAYEAQGNAQGGFGGFDSNDAPPF